MSDKSNVIVSEVDEETLLEISAQEKSGTDFLCIKENETPKEIVERIMTTVDKILESGDLSEEAVADISIQLGVIWGKMVEKKYGWKWKRIDLGDGNSILCLLSPQEYFVCNPLYFIHKILSGKNIAHYGENDNTVLLLFNMLDGIENQKPSQKYQFIS